MITSTFSRVLNLVTPANKLTGLVFTFLISLVQYTTNAQVSCPSNVDLELGNFTNWSLYQGLNAGASGISGLTATTPLTTRFTITSGTGVDYYGGFPVVAPGGGTYSLKLGNDNTGAQVDQARYAITVPTGVNNYSLIYRYAVVFENPAHSVTDQPYFRVKVYNAATNAVIACASYTYVSQSGIAGFSTSTHSGVYGGSVVYYKNWATSSLNLSGQAGNTLVVEFTAADCALGAHMGYGYVDMSCGLFAITNNSCNGASTAPLTAPAGFMTYRWYDSSYANVIDSGQSVTVPSTSTSTRYHVILTPFPGYGCVDTLTTTVQSSTLAASLGADTMLCNNASITLTPTVTSNAAPLTYSWSPATNLSCTACAAPVASPTTATNYILTVTDAMGCVKKDTINVKAPVALTATGTNALCYGTPTGSATAVASSGTSPYTYTWNSVPAQTGPSLTNAVAGTYTVTATDDKGCTATKNVTLNQFPQINSSIGSITNVSCYGGNNGQATATVTGGTPPYTYSWNSTPVKTTAAVTGLSAGTYTLTITDAQGCIKTDSVLVTQPTVLIPAATATAVSCNGGANGAITIVGSGGTSAYTYANGTGAYSSSGSFTGLSAGTYTIHTKDAHACIKDTVVTIAQPTLLTLATSNVQPLCNGASNGSVTLTGGGGTPPYTYSLGAGAYASASAFTGLAAGTYTFNIRDANNCTKSTTLSLGQPTAVTISYTSTNVLCNGGSNGSITVTAAGGTPAYTYAVDAGTPGATNLLTGLSAGIHTIHVADAAGCTRDSSLTITEPTPIAIACSVVQPLCHGAANGTITVSATGATPAFQYALGSGAFGSSGAFTALTAGTYTLHIRDANNCTKDSTVVLTEPTALSLTASKTDVTCNGASNGAISISGLGGTTPYTYSANSGSYGSSNLLTGLPAGTHTVHVKDAKGCIKDTTITIVQPTPIVIGYTAVQPLCSGAPNGSITISATSGTSPYLYALNSSTFTASGSYSSLSAGTYVLHVKDANSCIKDSTVVLNQNSPLAFSLSVANPQCYGATTGAVTVTPGGGTPSYTYAVDAGTFGTGNVLSGLSASAHVIHMLDGNGCSRDSIITITQPTRVTPSAVVTDVTCNGLSNGTVVIAATGGTPGYTYSKGTGSYVASGTFAGLAAGTYTFHLKDANNCISDTTVTVTEPTALSLSAVSTNVLCNGGSNGSVIVTGFGGTPAYTYASDASAYGGSNILSGLNAGTHVIHLKDTKGCIKDTTLTISQPSPITVSCTSAQPLCTGASNGSIAINAGGGTSPYTYAIGTSIFSSNATYAGLGAGTYIVHIKDANNCIKDTTVLLTQPTSLLIHTASTNVACNGAATGLITVTATGGTAAYAYALDTGSFGTSNILSGLTAGQYTIHLKDANGCTKDTVLNITQPRALNIAPYTTTLPLCNGANNGSISISGGGGSAPYQYAIGTSTFTSSGTFNGLAAGTYLVHIRDANNCTVDSTIILGQLSSLGLALTTTDVLCHGGNTGAVTVTGTGGNPGYTYAVDANSFGSSNVLTGLVAGTHIIHLKDANNCIKDSAVTIGQPTPLTVVSASNAASCYGAANSSIVITASGGAGPYQYALNTGLFDTTTLYTGLTAGSYILHTRDEHGCTKDTTVVLSQPAPLALSCTASPALCNGSSTGTIVVTASGGTLAYAYAVNSGAFGTAGTLTGLSAGTYIVHLRDANGCTKDSTVSITEPGIVRPAVNVTNVTCNGAANGTVVISASGGTGTGYSYANGTGAFSTSGTFSGLAAGTYVFHVKDANNCAADTTITVSEPPSMLLSATSSDVLCYGSSTGTVTLTAFGGTPAYTYALDAGAFGTSNVLTGLTSGSHVIHVKDLMGCTKDTTIISVQPSPLVAGHTSVEPLCHGNTNGSISVSASGGIAPYTYALNAGSFGSSTLYTSLAAGSYVLHIRDANGCTTDSSISLKEPDALYVSAGIADVPCNGGTGGGLMSAIGGTPAYTYAVNSGAFSTSPSMGSLPAGSQVLHVRDMNGCTADSTIVISTPLPLDMSLSFAQPLCNGGSTGTAAVTALGGTPPYQYAINTGAYSSTGSFSGLAAGTYILHVRDAHNCNKDTTIIIGQPAPLAALATHTNVLCYGGNSGTAQVSVSGGTTPYAYTWSGLGSTSANVYTLTAGTYTVSVIDNNGCTFPLTIAVTQPPQLIVSDTTTAPVCYGTATGTATALAAGGTAPYNYTWTTPSAQTTSGITALVSGTYVVTVVDSHGCSMLDSAIVPQTPPVVLAVSTTQVSCYGGSDGGASVSASQGRGPYSYSWNTVPSFAGASATALPAGSYKVIATSADGCMDSSIVLINEPPKLLASVHATKGSCPNAKDGILTSNVAGGTAPYTYFWSSVPVQNVPTFAGVSAGTYSLVVIDSMGCQQADSATVLALPAPVINVSPDQKICAGKSVVLGVGGAATYQWSALSSTPCTACNSITVSPAQTTRYQVIGASANGCTDTAEINVEVIQHVPVSVNEKLKICEGDSVQLGADGGITYLWSPSASLSNSRLSNPLARPAVSTTYSVLIKENECFLDTLAQEVEVLPTPTLELGKDIKSYKGASIELHAVATNASIITWLQAVGLSCTDCYDPRIEVTGPGRYIAQVSNALGCKATDTVNITDMCDLNNFFMANTFTPNGDGQNDRFYPQGTGIPKVDNFMIYDRWGEIVFSATNIMMNDPYAGWDGTFKSQQLKPDVYLYVVTASCDNGSKVVMKGDVTLVR